MTVMRSAVEVSVDGTTKPTGTVVYKPPDDVVTTDVPADSADAGVVPTFSHVVAVPLTVSVCAEFAEKPLPVIAICAPGLTAGSASSFGCTLNVAVAYAPLAPWTIMVCAPAVAAAGMLKPELMSIPPFVLMTVKPTGVPAVIPVLSNVTVIDSPALNPEPVSAIFVNAPRVPDVGLTAIDADATLSVPVAVLTPSDSDRAYEPGM